MVLFHSTPWWGRRFARCTLHCKNFTPEQKSAWRHLLLHHPIRWKNSHEGQTSRALCCEGNVSSLSMSPQTICKTEIYKIHLSNIILHISTQTNAYSHGRTTLGPSMSADCQTVYDSSKDKLWTQNDPSHRPGPAPGSSSRLQALL